MGSEAISEYTFTEWLFQVNAFLKVRLGKNVSDFRGFKWVDMFAKGMSPLEVVFVIKHKENVYV